MLSHQRREWIRAKGMKVTSALLSLVSPWICRLIYLQACWPTWRMLPVQLDWPRAKEKRGWGGAVCRQLLLSPGLLGQGSEPELSKVFVWFPLNSRSEATSGDNHYWGTVWIFLGGTPKPEGWAQDSVQLLPMLKVLHCSGFTDTEIINQPFYSTKLIIYTVPRQVFLLNSHAAFE